jgi:hypothetical protein
MINHLMYSSGKVGAISDGNRPKSNSADLSLDPTRPNLIETCSIVLEMKHEDRLTKSSYYDFMLRILHKLRIKIFRLQNNHIPQHKHTNELTVLP